MSCIISKMNTSDPIFFRIEGIGILIVGSVGFFINLIAIIMIFRQRVFYKFHYLLISLAFYDILYVCLSLAWFSFPHVSVLYRDRFQIHLIPYLMPAAQITLSGSSFTTVALTVERFISVCKPYLTVRYNIRSRHFILPVLIFSLLYNLPRFFEWRTVVEDSVKSCDYLSPEPVMDNCTITVRNVTLVSLSLRKNQWYKLVSIFYNELLPDKTKTSN